MSEKAESQEREADVSEEIRRCSATKLSGFAAGRSQKAYLWTSSKPAAVFSIFLRRRVSSDRKPAKRHILPCLRAESKASLFSLVHHYLTAIGQHYI
jgi:hypothetical protein